MNNIEELTIILNDHIASTLKDPKLKLSCKAIIKKELKSSLFFQSGDFFQGNTYKNIEKQIISNLKDYIKSDSFRNKISSILDDKIVSLEKSDLTVSKAIPPSFINGIKVYVYNNSPEIAKSIKNMINSENVQKRLKNEISNAVGGMNPMIAKFIDMNMVYGKLITGINSYIDNPDNVMDFVNAINGYIDNFAAKEIREFLMYFPAEGRNSMVKSISNNLVTSMLSDDNMKMISSKINESIRDSSNISSVIDSLVQSDSFDRFMEELYDKVMENNEFKNICNTLSESIINKVLNMPLKDLLV